MAAIIRRSKKANAHQKRQRRQENAATRALINSTRANNPRNEPNFNGIVSPPVACGFKDYVKCDDGAFRAASNTVKKQAAA